MLNEEFDPYELLMENTLNIEQLALFCHQQSKLIESLVKQNQDFTNIIVDLNTRLNAAQHRVTRLERQYEVITASTNHSQ